MSCLKCVGDCCAGHALAHNIACSPTGMYLHPAEPLGFRGLLVTPTCCCLPAGRTPAPNMQRPLSPGGTGLRPALVDRMASPELTDGLNQMHNQMLIKQLTAAEKRVKELEGENMRLKEQVGTGIASSLMEFLAKLAWERKPSRADYSCQLVCIGNVTAGQAHELALHQPPLLYGNVPAHTVCLLSYGDDILVLRYRLTSMSLRRLSLTAKRRWRSRHDCTLSQSCRRPRWTTRPCR